MPVVRFVLCSALALVVLGAGVIVGTGVAGAALGPRVEHRLADPSSGATRCPVRVDHEVGYDAAEQTYAVRALHVSAPTCPPGTQVAVAIDGTAVGHVVVDEAGAGRLELTDPVAAASVRNLQVSTVS